MSIRQYIPVKAFADPDPAVFCPPRGYEIPADPNILEPDPEWYPVGNPGNEEIILTCSDGGDRRIAFYATIQNSGTYTVYVYGASNELLNTQVKASSAAWSYQFIAGAGFAGTGQTTFKVKIVPTLGTNHILGFCCQSISGNPIQNWQILQAKFNTPGITTLTSAFAGIDALRGIEFFSSLNSLSLCANMCYNCSSLKSIAFPALPALTTFSQTFYGCNLLTSCVFNGPLPLCNTMTSMFYQCLSLPSQVYPPDLPEMTNMTSIHYGNSALRSVTLPLTMNKLYQMSSAFYSCNAIQYIKMPTSLPLLEQLQSTFSNCKVLNTIDFCTSVPKLVNCMNMCYGSPALKSFTFPSTLNYLTNLSYTFGWCYSLKTLKMPTNAPEVTTLYQFCANCYVLSSCTLPSSLTKVTTLYQAFMNCYEMTTCVYPPTMDAVLTMYCVHFTNKLLTSVTFPTSMNACTTAGQGIQGSISLVTCVMPASMNALQSLNAFLFGCTALSSVTPPPSLPAINDISSFTSADTLVSYFGQIAFPATQVNAGGITSGRLITSFYQPTLRASIFNISGSPLSGNLMTSVEIDWANSTYGGVAPQILLNYLNLSSAEINRILTALPTVSGKTINVSLCTGSATCNPAIATAKGWTVLR